MSTDAQEMEMGSKPVQEHEWLQNLIGEWRTECTMSMGPDAPAVTCQGTETVRSLDGMWAFTEGKGQMPNGEPMEYFATLGYDLTFHEYRGCWFSGVSSHLWKHVGELSSDGKTMTLTCEGPHMEKDGETAMYRDVIEIVDRDHRTMTSYGQDEHGAWQEFMKVSLTRA